MKLDMPPLSVFINLCPACQHSNTCRGYRKGEAANGELTCLGYKPAKARAKEKMKPAHVLALPDREPCADCACRTGSVPNGTPHTMADFEYCVREMVPFLCHEGGAGRLCAGWVRSVKARARSAGASPAKSDLL